MLCECSRGEDEEREERRDEVGECAFKRASSFGRGFAGISEYSWCDRFLLLDCLQRLRRKGRSSKVG